MIQKQKIEAQYLKLIGVTLMMTATCVSEAGNKRALRFADENVREIILEQFQLLSSGHLAEVIEWEHAIKQATESHAEQSAALGYTYYRLLTVNKAHQLLTDSCSAACVNASQIHTSYRLLISPTVQQRQWYSVINRNKYCLITRAGPMA